MSAAAEDGAAAHAVDDDAPAEQAGGRRHFDTTYGHELRVMVGDDPDK
jgi:hypothetical protein